MKPIILHDEAEHELFAAEEYYQRIHGYLSERFLYEFDETAQRIQRHPELYSKSFKQTRLALVQKFPYTIVYRNLTSTIFIVAVAHKRRRPGYWIRRLP